LQDWVKKFPLDEVGGEREKREASFLWDAFHSLLSGTNRKDFQVVPLQGPCWIWVLEAEGKGQEQSDEKNREDPVQ
jgi:hypothetical protein